MANPKFKIGDRIRPIPGRKQSNYNSLQNLKELIVTHNNVYNGNSNNNMIRARITFGSSTNHSTYNNYYQKDLIEVIEQAFELIEPEEDDYEIF